MKKAVILSPLLGMHLLLTLQGQQPPVPPSPPGAGSGKPAATNVNNAEREAVLRSFMKNAPATNGPAVAPPGAAAAAAGVAAPKNTPLPGVPGGAVAQPATPRAAASSATAPAAPPSLPPAVPASRTGRVTPAATATTTPAAGTPAGAKAEAEDPLKNFDTSNPPLAEDDPDAFMDNFRFLNMPLDQFLDSIYAAYTGKTVLRSAQLPAVQITLRAQTPLTREEVIQALDSVLALNGITMIPTGEKFVTAVPVAQAVQEGAAPKSRKIDELPEASQFITQIVQLKHVNPVEAQAVITPLAKNAAGIVVIESNKMLILRDYAINVKRMMEVLEKIDVFVPAEIQPEVIPIKYALASDISSVLSSLQSGGAGGAPVGSAAGASRSSRTGSRSSSRTGTGLGGNTGMNQFGQPNALGATGTGGLGNTANRTGATGGSFQQRLQQIVSRAASTGELQILGDVKILPDERTNSLLVFAGEQDLKMIKNIISKLDIVLQQVLIEALIMEVSTDNGRSLGVSYRGAPKTSGKFTGVGGVNNGQGFLSTFPNVAATGTNTAAALPGGFSYFGQMAGNFDFALQAIADDSTINVIQRPRIQTSHAVPASFFVGETVPTITGSAYGDFGSLYGGSRNSYTQLRVGVQLDVTPLINPDGLVVMDIQQKIDQLGPNVKIDNNDVPTTTSREASATIAVRDRDTIILGGFIKSDKQGSKSGVPVLKDVPLLGALFRSSSDRKRQTEMMVLMRPTVLPTPEAASLAAKADKNITPEIRRAEQDYESELLRRNRKADQSEAKRLKKNQ